MSEQNSAPQTLAELAEIVRQRMKPEGRANAAAGSLEQLGRITPDANLADLVEGWRICAEPKATEEAGPVQGRRATCGELVQLAAQTGGSRDRAIEAWTAWIAAFQGSNDPRQATMAATFQRELDEIRTAQA